MIRKWSHDVRDWLRVVRRRTREQFLTQPVPTNGHLKLPILTLGKAMTAAPFAARGELLRQALRSSQPAPAEMGGIHSLGEYPAAYACLAEMLGRPTATPPPGEVQFLESIITHRRNYPGKVGADDYFFLNAFVSILAPQRVVEIGTLTGFSAAIIAAALERRHGKAAWVDTIDIKGNCSIDETRPTGFEIEETFPKLSPMIRVHVPHDASLVRQLAQRDELELAFVDAGHAHPQPLLDLLQLAPYVRAGGWIIFHDTRLGSIGREQMEAGQELKWGAPFGVEWLFDFCPFRKISGGNIGAVQMPNDKRSLIPFALRLVSLPSELSGRIDRRTRDAVFQSLTDLL